MLMLVLTLELHLPRNPLLLQSLEAMGHGRMNKQSILPSSISFYSLLSVLENGLSTHFVADCVFLEPFFVDNASMTPTACTCTCIGRQAFEFLKRQRDKKTIHRSQHQKESASNFNGVIQLEELSIMINLVIS